MGAWEEDDEVFELMMMEEAMREEQRLRAHKEVDRRFGYRPVDLREDWEVDWKEVRFVLWALFICMSIGAIVGWFFWEKSILGVLLGALSGSVGALLVVVIKYGFS